MDHEITDLYRIGELIVLHSHAIQLPLHSAQELLRCGEFRQRICILHQIQACIEKGKSLVRRIHPKPRLPEQFPRLGRVRSGSHLRPADLHMVDRAAGDRLLPPAFSHKENADKNCQQAPFDEHIFDCLVGSLNRHFFLTLYPKDPITSPQVRYCPWEYTIGSAFSRQNFPFSSLYCSSTLTAATSARKRS